MSVTSPGASSTISASSVNVGYVWIGLDDQNGHNNQTKVTVMDFEVDYILIRDAPGGGGNNLCDPANYTSYPVGHSITLYGAEWNESVGYIRDVPTASTWNSSDPTIVSVTTPGSSSTLTCSDTNFGTVTITLDDGQGNQNTTQVTVLTPTTDFIQIRDAPDGGGNILTNMIYDKGATDNYYGSAYNDTAGYIGPVPSISTWDSNNTNIVTVTSPGNFTTITCDNTNSGWVRITLDDGEGNQNQTLVNVLGWSVDYVLIRDAPGGAGNNLCDPGYYPNFPVGHTTTFYGALYNISGGYLGDVSSSSTWVSDDTGIVMVSPTGSSTSIICHNQNWGTVTITLTDIDNGVLNTTQVSVLEPTVDIIQIRDSPNDEGIVLSDPANYPVYSQAHETTFYGAEYNDTAGYIGSVPVTSTWDSNDTAIVAVSSPTNKTTVTCSNVNVGLVWITLDDGDGHENHTLVTVIKAVIDYLRIRDAPNGEGINLCDPGNYPVFGVGHTTKFYAAGYNQTQGYIVDVPVKWSVTDDSIVNVTTSGSFSDILCSDTNEGAVTITVDDNQGNTNTTQVTVLPPTINYIQIRDSPLGGGNVITTGTYIVSDVDIFYAAAYNSTAGYLEDPEVSWSSDNTDVGQVSSPGIWTNFTAQNVAINSTCKITATYTPSITNTTDLLTVLAPRIDDIRIRDDAYEEGDIVITRTYSASDTDVLYAAGYNDTVGYVRDVEVTWESDDTSVGKVTSPGNSSTFTAQNVMTNSTCTVTATYSMNIFNSTGLITVEPTMDVIAPSSPSQPTLDLISKNKIEISWDPNTEPDLDDYIIQRSTSPDGPWLYLTVLDKDTTSYNDTGLELDTTYYYQIIAVDEAGNPSDPSPAASITTPIPEDDAFPWVLVSLIILIIIIVVFVLLFLFRKKSE
ncbi:MAG: fibronectin type III domain-containing protein [Thermoplasmata archaeon]|nr:MAG: fibronectin type III domain-containing protein [Thermoplasmata archaeon]